MTTLDNQFNPDWDQIKPFNDRIAELEKVAKQALETLKGVIHAHGYNGGTPVEAITALRQALEQPRPASEEDMKIYKAIADNYHTSKQPAQPAKLKVTLEDRPIDIELAQYKRMFEAACSALGQISDALGCDPEEGGAEPILAAIAELNAEQPAYQEPVAWALEWTFNGEERCYRLYDDERHCIFDAGSDGGVCRPLYTHPPVIDKSAAIRIATALGWEPKREWVGLTLEDKKRILYNDFGGNRLDCMDEAEKILKEKNT